MKSQPDDARTGTHSTPSEHQRTGPDDAGANLVTGADSLGAGSPAGLSAPPDGFNKRESYCLFVRVLKDCKELLERDRLIPPHSWNEGLCLEICQARSGVPPGTLAVELLSDSEFLLMKLPKTGRGMTYDDAGLIQDCIEGSYYWGELVPLSTLHAVPAPRLGGTGRKPVTIGEGQRRRNSPPPKPV